MSVFQVRRLFSPGRVQYFPWRLETLHCRVYCTCTADDICTSTVFWSLHLHCQLIFTSTVFWSCQIKTICFSLAIGSRAFCTVTERSDQDGSSECVRIKRLLSRSNSRMDHQDEQRAASNRAIQALVSQVSELTTQLQRLQTEPEQRPTASNSPAPTIPDQVGRFIEPRLPPPAFYSGEPQLCRSFLAKCSLYIKCSSNHRRFLPRNRR